MIAAGASLAASQLASQDIGLASEPLTAGEGLVAWFGVVWLGVSWFGVSWFGGRLGRAVAAEATTAAATMAAAAAAVEDAAATTPTTESPAPPRRSSLRPGYSTTFASAASRAGSDRSPIRSSSVNALTVTGSIPSRRR